MPIPAADILHAEIVMEGLMASKGSTAVNTVTVFHYRRRSNAPALDKTTLEASFQSIVGDAIVAALNETWSETRVRIRWLDDATDPYQDFTESHAGEVTGQRMAAHNAAYILLKTGVRGKNFKGSKHLGPLSESDTSAATDDILNAGAITNFQDVLDGLTTALTDSGGNFWDLCVVSRELSQLVTNPTTVESSLVTEAVLNERIGLMRRRKVASKY